MTLKRCLLILAWVSMSAFAPARAADDASSAVQGTDVPGAVPAATAQIARFYIDPAPAGPGYETGDLHIVYSDKTEVTEALAPWQQSTEHDIVDNETGIADPRVADDKRTIAWTETYATDCCSYSIPLVLAVYASGKRILHIRQGQVLWYWEFQGAGKQVVAVWAANHGPFDGDYQLYDTQSGKLVEEVYVDQDTQSLGAHAPDWAKKAEADCGRCGGP